MRQLNCCVTKNLQCRHFSQTGCVQWVSSTRTAQTGRMASCREEAWLVSAPVNPTCSTSPARHMSPVWLDVPALLGECPAQSCFVHNWVVVYGSYNEVIVTLCRLLISANTIYCNIHGLHSLQHLRNISYHIGEIV